MRLTDKEFWMSYRGLFFILALCVFVFAGIYSLTYLFKEPNNAGDTAGLVNGLFSALAFAGVIYAIFLQRHELEMQREELKGQREEFTTQNETLKRQRFENTFFNMLQLHEQITDSITYSYVVNKKDPSDSLYKEFRNDLKGREVFREAFETAPHEASDRQDYYGMRGLLSVDGIKGYENNFTPTYFDHYFRHLYRIFKFVATSDLIKDEDRYEYASIARAQLSRYELIWLYYNGLSIYGKDKFKPYIEKFALLKNLRTDMLVVGLNTEIEYSASAFRK